MFPLTQVAVLSQVKFLEEHPSAAACCARQRAQSAIQQGCATPEILRSPSRWWLRQLQAFDFEVLEHCLKPAFDAIDYIPVLPGPGSLYRYAAFAAGPMERYFELRYAEAACT